MSNMWMCKWYYPHVHEQLESSPLGNTHIYAETDMDSDTLQNNETTLMPWRIFVIGLMNYVFSTVVKLECRINSRTSDGSAMLHKKACMNWTAELLGKSERSTTLKRTSSVRLGRTCSDICLEVMRAFIYTVVS